MKKRLRLFRYSAGKPVFMDRDKLVFEQGYYQVEANSRLGLHLVNGDSIPRIKRLVDALAGYEVELPENIPLESDPVIHFSPYGANSNLHLAVGFARGEKPIRFTGPDFRLKEDVLLSGDFSVIDKTFQIFCEHRLTSFTNKERVTEVK